MTNDEFKQFEEAKQRAWDEIIKSLHLEQILDVLSLGINNFWDWVYEVFYER